MGFRNLLFKLLPAQFHLPGNYFYMKCRGALEEELFILEELVPDGKVCIDIGANDGVYTYRLSKLCEQVEAFEPQPGCSELLKSYGAPNVRVHCCALSDTPGLLDLHIPSVNGRVNSGYATFGNVSEEHLTLRVPVRRLDDFNFENVSFIKIDVEGHESRVVAGATETILRERPIILIEIEQRHLGTIQIKDVFEQIHKLGYKGFFFLNNRYNSIDKFSLKDHQEKFLNDVSNRGYVNNFIFKPD